MGTSWDIYCLDCDDEAGVSASYSPIRQNELWPMLEAAPAIGALAERLVSWELAEYGGGVRAPISWLAKHSAHRLRLRSEYGEIEGQCGKDYCCGHCKSRLGYCERDVGHDGPCGKRSSSPASYYSGFELRAASSAGKGGE